MVNFRRDDRAGGRQSYSQGGFQRRSFGGRGEDRQMHRAVCSNCGRDCEVPFLPTGDKPVFCSECFEKRNRDLGPRRFEDRGSRRPNFESSNRPQNNVQLEAINTKLGKILEILTSLTASKVENLRPQPKKAVAAQKKAKAPKKAAKII